MPEAETASTGERKRSEHDLTRLPDRTVSVHLTGPTT